MNSGYPLDNILKMMNPVLMHLTTLTIQNHVYFTAIPPYFDPLITAKGDDFLVIIRDSFQRPQLNDVLKHCEGSHIKAAVYLSVEEQKELSLYFHRNLKELHLISPRRYSVSLTAHNDIQLCPFLTCLSITGKTCTSPAVLSALCKAVHTSKLPILNRLSLEGLGTVTKGNMNKLLASE